jgi:transposase
MLHRVRRIVVKQRTIAINTLRGQLSELGLVSTKGRDGTVALVELVEARAGAKAMLLTGWRV